MRTAGAENFKSDADGANRATAAEIPLGRTPAEERAQVRRARRGVAGAHERQGTATLPVNIPSSRINGLVGIDLGAARTDTAAVAFPDHDFGGNPAVKRGIPICAAGRAVVVTARRSVGADRLADLVYGRIRIAFDTPAGRHRADHVPRGHTVEIATFGSSAAVFVAVEFIAAAFIGSILSTGTPYIRLCGKW